MILKVDLKPGSSKLGNACLAFVGCKCVAAYQLQDKKDGGFEKDIKSALLVEP